MAIGRSPPIAVSVVRMIGKNLTSPASLIAWSNGIPSALNWFVKSTSKIVFFTSIPANAMMPIDATKESDWPVISSANTAPTMPSGITDKTIKVLLKVLNSNTSTAIKKNIVMMMMFPKPPNDSFLLSNSPPML